MERGTAVAAIIVVAVLGFVGGYLLGGYGGEVVEGTPPVERGGSGYDSNIIPIGESPVLGEKEAPVTMVFFADFATASSGAAAGIIAGVTADERFGQDVRVAIKVLPSRADESRAAAAAVYYAAERGELFDGLYDGLVENAASLDAATLDRILNEAGLDAADFRANLVKYESLVDADVNLARSLGVGRAPAVFVNGRELSGNDLNAGPLREAVFGEQEAVSALGETVSDDQVYSLRVRENAAPRALVARRERADERAGERRERPEPDLAERPSRVREVERPAEQRAAVPPADDVERMRVPIGDSYVRGADDALVTIVEFSDFHCPFCSRVNPTLEQLFDEYGDDLRLSFKHNPLPMHPEAPMAHQAALAAGAQGKFWEMHDLLFANQRARSLEDLQAHARTLGLDVDAFTAFITEERGNETISEDQALSSQVGARGTPHFFINGRRVRGAQPIEQFREVIDSELAHARQLMQEGVARADLYDHIMEGAQERATAEAPSRPEAPAVVEPPPIGASAVRGPDDAPVTIFIFSEFQCPFCGRAQPTMQQIEEEYGDRVRFVFKAFPLPFHGNADLASQAALAAGEQGKFWEYHDILFANQRALERADLERYAEQLGLDMQRFRDALDTGRFVEQVQTELAEGRRAGVSGTPTFLINGERLVGAVPFDRFQPLIDRHLSD